MTLRNLLLVSIATATLTACSSKPAPDLYVLRVPDDAPTRCETSRTLVIDRPAASNEIDSKRIAVMLDRNHLTHYTGAAWASPFPEQLQSFLSDALSQQGISVIDGNTADADHASVLHLTIREADITNADAPIVHLRLSGSISNPSGRATRFKVNESIPAEQNHMPQIVDAYDTAATNAASTIATRMKLRCKGVPAGD